MKSYIYYHIRSIETLISSFETFIKFVRICYLYIGGILCRGITEIAGESASGKTQLCMQLCLTVQLAENMNGLDAGKTASIFCE